jgi:L-2,4-diaminobutyrate decarboxylase
MSTDGFNEAFGLPRDWALVFRRLRSILEDVFEPETPFEPPNNPALDLDQNSGVPLDKLLVEVHEKIVAHAVNPRHPMSLAHMVPPPATVSVIADLLIGALNQCAFIWEEAPLAAVLERQVIGWVADRIGFGPERGGLLTSGGTMSNCLATFLALARDESKQSRNRRDVRYRIIASDQAHLSIEKAAVLNGLGRNAVHRIETDKSGRLRAGCVRRAVNRVLRSGEVPLMLVCTAGTTNAGTIEPLEEFLSVARDVGSWCHVDAAYGGLLSLSDRAKQEVQRWPHADSLSWDPHKSLYASYGVGTLIMRDGRALESLEFNGDYALKRGAYEDAGAFHLEGSRRLESLKVWMCIKHLGLEWYRNTTNHTLELARELAARVTKEEEFQLILEPDTNIVCFRYVADGLDDHEVDELNHSVQTDLYHGGGPLVSTTQIAGRTVFRAVLLNPRLRVDDLGTVLDGIKAAAHARISGIGKSPVNRRREYCHESALGH